MRESCPLVIRSADHPRQVLTPGLNVATVSYSSQTNLQSGAQSENEELVSGPRPPRSPRAASQCGSESVFHLSFGQLGEISERLWFEIIRRASWLPAAHVYRMSAANASLEPHTDDK